MVLYCSGAVTISRVAGVEGDRSRRGEAWGSTIKETAIAMVSVSFAISEHATGTSARLTSLL